MFSRARMHSPPLRYGKRTQSARSALSPGTKWESDSRARSGGRLFAVVTEIRAEIRDFRSATTASFNALRADFGDLHTHVDRGFAEMRCKLDTTAGWQQHIADLIQRLINGQDR